MRTLTLEDIEELRAEGRCMNFSRPQLKSLLPYVCSLRIDHSGPHKAYYCGDLLDAWDDDDAIR